MGAARQGAACRVQAVRTKSLLEGALLAALVALLGLVSFAAGQFWLLAIPILLAYLRNGGRNAVMVTGVGSFLLLLWGGPFVGLSTLGFGAALGLTPGWAIRRGAGAAWTVVLMGAAFLAVTVLGALGAIVVLHYNFWAQQWTAVTHSLRAHPGLLKTLLRLTPEAGIALLRNAIPVLATAVALGQAAGAYVIAALVLSRLHAPLPTVAPFADWRAPRWLFWVYMLAFAVYLRAHGKGEQVLPAAALNLLMGLGLVYTVTGLATAYGWLRRRGLPRARSALIVALGAALLGVVIPILGMLASLMDLREPLGGSNGWNGGQRP